MLLKTKPSSIAEILSTKVVKRENVFIIEEAINQSVTLITGDPLRPTIPKDRRKWHPSLQPRRDNPLPADVWSRNHTFLEDCTWRPWLLYMVCPNCLLGGWLPVSPNRLYPEENTSFSDLYDQRWFCTLVQGARPTGSTLSQRVGCRDTPSSGVQIPKRCLSGPEKDISGSQSWLKVYLVFKRIYTRFEDGRKIWVPWLAV